MNTHKFTWKDIETPTAYAQRLKTYGYYGDSYNTYIKGMTNALKKISDYGKTIIEDPIKAAKDNPTMMILVMAAGLLLINMLFGNDKRG
jgi:hypothetical protein